MTTTSLGIERGDVVLVLFPHSDLRTAKLRPALVVQANDLRTGLPQLIVAMVTGKYGTCRPLQSGCGPRVEPGGSPIGSGHRFRDHDGQPGDRFRERDPADHRKSSHDLGAVRFADGWALYDLEDVPERRSSVGRSGWAKHFPRRGACSGSGNDAGQPD